MPDQLQLRGGTTAEHSTFTGAIKEVTVDTSKKTVVVHDGTTAGGLALLRQDGSNSALALGSEGTPSLKWDANTGIFSPGDDQLAIVTGANRAITITSTQAVGVKTPNPNAALHVAGSARVGADSAADAILEIGEGATGNRNSYIDIVADTTYTDYGLRIIRNNTGANATSELKHRGTGALNFTTQEAAPIVFNTTNSPALTITSGGLVGIGVTSPGYPLSVKTTTDGGQSIFNLDNEDAGNYGGLRVHLGNTDRECRLEATYNSSFFTFYTAASSGSGTERARIDSSGRLLVGTSSTSGENCTLQVRNNSALAAEFFTSSDDTTGPYIHLTKSRGTAASPTEVSSGDTLGAIAFFGYDGSTYRTAARIVAEADGTWTDGGDTTDNPGRLVFSTTADGGSSPTERMRITSGGTIFQYSHQYNFSSSESTIEFVNRDSGGAKTFTWYVGASGGSPVATLSTAGVWTNASDVRYKENIQDISYGINTVKQLQPRSFDIISTGNAAIGFVAQELKENIPEVIHEVPTHDGEVYLNVDYGSLTAVLTKALQEAIAKIESLEAKVAALEAS